MSVFCPEIGEKVTYLICQDCTKKVCRNEKETFALLIVGSRTMTDYSLFRKKTDKLIAPLRQKYNFLIVSGGAKGADSLAEKYAKENGFGVKIFPADWKSGPSAGYRRNEKMHEYISRFERRGCIAFWDGISRGTAHSFSLASRYSNPLMVIRIDR